MYQEECEYDSVEIVSKLGDDIYRKHGIFCGARSPPLITSEGNFMRITFTSDNRSCISYVACITIENIFDKDGDGEREGGIRIAILRR